MTVLLHPRHHAHCTENMLIGAMGETETWGYLISQGALGLAEMTEAEAECNGSFTAAALLWASSRQRSTVRKRDGEREKEKEKESKPLSCNSCSVKHTSLNDIMLLSVCHAIVSTKKLYKTCAKN